MISKFSVKKPYTVLVAVVLAIILGVVSFTRMTTDLLPSITLPYVIVMTTYAGASPETVETVVTRPVESSMATVSNIEGISSVSNENYSMVILEFAQTADMNAISLEIRENLDQIETYWDDSVGSPIIMKMNPDMLPVMIAAVGVEGMDDAEVSTYAENHIIPELESLEGVASVSATGLIEESVNVIIRQEKVDELNKKIFAAIDDQMEEARQELEDGRAEIADGQKELEDAKKEISDGRSEMAEGKEKLEEGKTELENQRTATAAQLAEAEKQLLTAKADLEAAKISMTTEIATIQQLDAAFTQASAGITQLEQAVIAMQGMINSLSLAANDQDTFNASVNSILQSGQLSQELTAAISSCYDQTTSNYNSASVLSVVGAAKNTLETTLADAKIKETELRTAISTKTNLMGAAAYIQFLNTQLAEINTNITKVDQGLVELSKGKLTASIEFSNANTQIVIGESQMSAGEAQLDAAEEQLKSGREQLESALEQIEDGEEQLAEAQEDAYQQADMKEVVTVSTIQSLLTAQNFSMPAGYVTEDGINYMVRVGDKPASAEELAALPLLNLHMDGVDIVTLGDVADVFYTDNSGESYTNVNGNPGIMLTIQKQTGYSTGDVSEKLQNRFDDLMEENSDLSLIALMDQGIYIDIVMDSIFNSMIFGSILAILILIVFLRDIRPTFVIACSIPISIVVTVVCMYFSGVTLNIISLSGLALGIGMLVDNSIVVIENIYRLRNEGYSRKDAAIEGAKEVSGAIVASTLTTICVFLPIVFTEGITRQLFVDMGLTIGYSLVASLVIALTVVPAISSKILVKTKDVSNSKFFTYITNGYGKILEICLKIKPVILLAVIGLLVGSAALAFSKGTAFMPEMDSTQLSVSVELEEGATPKEVADASDQVVEKIMELEDVQDVGAMDSSSGSIMGGGGNSTSSTIYVVTREDKTTSNEELASIIMDKTKDIQATITIETSTMDMSALGGSGISIQVRGRELDEIQRIAGEVAALLETVEGTTMVSDGLEDSTEELRIVIDKNKAMEYGLTVAQVFSQIQPKLAESTSSTTLSESDKDYGVFVSNETDTALTRELVRELTVDGTNDDGETIKVPLEDIVNFEVAEGLNSIQRAEQTRYVSVSAGIADGYNVGLVSRDVEEVMEDYQIPAGYSLEFQGENETINEAMSQLMLMLILAVLFMYLIMVAQFQSLLSPFIIMFTVPLAFTGGLFALFFSNSEVSVIAVIGFVMLAGIIVNNGIVLIDYVNQLREKGMEKKEALITAGKTRLRPVLMTALTTILAMSTMAFGTGMGADMSKPMAIVAIGGLVYGTILTLVVIPCIYDMFHPTKKVKEKVED